MSTSLSPILTKFVAIAADAGKVILSHYEMGTTARRKADQSPVTAADEEAEALIVGRLKTAFPNVPIVAEEAVARGEAVSIGDTFILVDPLDGTKEFLARNGEFTVNIAQIEGTVPVCGVVLAPALGRGFAGDVATKTAIAFDLSPDGSANLDSAKKIEARKAPDDGVIAMVSRTHRDIKTEEYLTQYAIKEMRAAGSSLKFCLLAAGEADFYPRHGRTMEWDVAAGHAVLAAAGGTVTQLDGSAFFYGKSAQRFANPYFLARGKV
jgi:3'(2'), 5'-bisphosphate nucleotidase